MNMLAIILLLVVHFTENSVYCLNDPTYPTDEEDFALETYQFENNPTFQENALLLDEDPYYKENLVNKDNLINRDEPDYENSPNLIEDYLSRYPGVHTFDHCVVPPRECPNENVTFYLYTRETQESPELIDMFSDEPIDRSKFVEGQPLKILIHGYTTNHDESPNLEIRPAYFKTYNYNIISVDHAPLVRDPCYYQAVENVPVIANCTAQMIDYLVNNEIVDIRDIHVIGFSLGGQISGHISNYLTSGKLPRITGLDPAMPLFTTPNTASKLDATDAEFVDVIHTDSGMRGKAEASGTVDFYVNGGYRQPGCASATDPSSCSHYRAPAFYAESINSDVGFWASPCSYVMTCMMGYTTSDDPKDKILLGEYVNKSAAGTYYVKTNSESPYAIKSDL